MADLYQRVFDRWIFPTWETRIRKRPTLSLAKDLEQSQWRSVEEQTAFQLDELRLLVDHAWRNVPWYQRSFQSVGLDPRDLTSLDDLRRLPILTKVEAAAEFQARTARTGAAVQIRKSTSGTMGQPLSFGYDLRSEYWRQATKLRGYQWAGHWPGRRTLHYWGASSPFRSPSATAKAELDHFLKRERYIDCGRRGSDDLDRVIDLVCTSKPDVMICYSQAAADLARRVLERKCRSWSDIAVICGAERLLPTDRELLEQAFGKNVFETYGCREVMLIGAECEAHTGLHISAENLLVEVLVRELGRDGKEQVRPANAGETGEVVLTDLHNWAMPFIRYANGDLAKMGSGDICACGRTLPRLSSVEGRVTETLLDADGNRVNGLIFNVVIAHLAGAIRQFQVVQHKDRSVSLRVVPSVSFDEGTEQKLYDVWRYYLSGVAFSLEKVSSIDPGPNGKRQVVLVEA